MNARAVFLSVYAMFLFLGVSACQTQTSDFCAIYSPVTEYGFLKESHEDLYLQIKTNNLVFQSICEEVD